jgi:hypothetical protein
MGTDNLLSAKIAEVKNKIQGYRSLPEYLLDGVGAALTIFSRPREKRSPFLPPNALRRSESSLPSYWLSGLIVATLTVLIGWLVSAITGAPITARDISVSAWAAAIGALALIVNKINIRTFLENFHESIIDKILSPDDVDDLEGWLDRNFKLLSPLVAGLVGGPILAYMLIENLGYGDLIPINLGTIVVVVLACIQSIWVAYYLGPFYLSLPPKLARYHFDLYTTDPSSSEVVGRLSRLMTFILYATLGFIVLLTIGLNQVDVFNLQTAFVFSLLIWVPTIVSYGAGQFHISSMIARAKWKTLNELQSKIEELYKYTLTEEGESPKKDILDVIEKLMDSHDRIKATPNSALNFRAGLNFLNSLLLPILAFVVANLGDVINFIESQFGN